MTKRCKTMLYVLISYLILCIHCIDPTKDYYSILGLKKDFTNQELKKAYRQLALKHHPDKAAESDREAASKKFMDISEAHEVLSDSEKKEQYDQARQFGSSGIPNQGKQGSPYTFKGAKMDPSKIFEQFFGTMNKRNQKDRTGNLFQEFQFSGMGGDGFARRRQSKQAPRALYSKQSKVVSLTNKKFPGKNAKHEWLVHFYTLKQDEQSNLRWKKDMESIIDDVGDRFKVGALDCDQYRDTCVKKGVSISSLPSFAYISRGELVRFTDKPERDSVFQFTIQQYKNSIKRRRNSGILEEITSANEQRICHLGKAVNALHNCVVFMLSTDPKILKKEMKVAERIYRRFAKASSLAFAYAIHDAKKDWTRQMISSGDKKKPFMLVLRVKQHFVRYHAHVPSDFTEEALIPTVERCIGGDLQLQEARIPIHF